MADLKAEILKKLNEQGIEASKFNNDVINAAIEEAKKIAPSLSRLVGKSSSEEVVKFLQDSRAMKTAMDNLSNHQKSTVSVAAGKARATNLKA